MRNLQAVRLLYGLRPDVKNRMPFGTGMAGGLKTCGGFPVFCVLSGVFMTQKGVENGFFM